MKLDVLVRVEKRIQKYYQELLEKDSDSINLCNSLINMIDLEDELLKKYLISKEMCDKAISWASEKIKFNDNHKININYNLPINLNEDLNKDTYPYFRIIAKSIYEKNKFDSYLNKEVSNINKNIFKDLETSILYQSLCDQALEFLMLDGEKISNDLKEEAYLSLINSSIVEKDVLQNNLIPSGDIYNPIPFIVDYNIARKLVFVKEKTLDDIPFSLNEFNLAYRITLVNRLKQVYSYLIEYLTKYILKYPEYYLESQIFNTHLNYLKSIIAMCPMDLRSEIYTNLNKYITSKTNESRSSYFILLVNEIDVIETELVPVVNTLALHK